jgi:hypothetical protein
LGIAWTFSGVIEIILADNLALDNKFTSIEVGYLLPIKK